MPTKESYLHINSTLQLPVVAITRGKQNKIPPPHTKTSFQIIIFQNFVSFVNQESLGLPSSWDPSISGTCLPLFHLSFLVIVRCVTVAIRLRPLHITFQNTSLFCVKYWSRRKERKQKFQHWVKLCSGSDSSLTQIRLGAGSLQTKLYQFLHFFLEVGPVTCNY